jgi:hypothetical protein
MRLVWAIVVLIHIVSFTFMALCLMRTFSYKQQNHFIESKYSLLFPVFRLDHVIIAYIVFVVIYAVSSIALIYYLAGL